MDRLCRVCMDSSVTLVDIFAERLHTSKKDPTLAEILNEFCEVKPQDLLPQSICLSCVLAAQNAYKFKKTCEESNRQLLQLLAMKDQESCNYIVPCVEAVYQNEEIPLNVNIKMEPVQQDELITSDTTNARTSTQSFDRRTLGHSLKQYPNTKEYPHRCRYCGKGFRALYPTRLHEKRHTGEKTFFCDSCGKGFLRAHDLKIHTRVHTGERFQCPHCPRSYLQNHLLKTHEQKHKVQFNNVESQRRIQTMNLIKTKKKVAKKPTAKSKVQNTKVQKPERGLRDKLPPVSYEELDMECEFNDIATMMTSNQADQNNLEQPMNKEQQENSISTAQNKEAFQTNGKVAVHFCDTCGRGFRRRYALIQHIRTHTGERPYKCHICPRAFTQAQALKRHIRQVHTDKCVRKEQQIPPTLKRVVVRVARIQLPPVLPY